MGDFRGTHRYQLAVRALKARARFQQCMTCPKTLDATLSKGHPLAITLGHIVAVEDGGDPFDPSNHGPQCGKCNYGDGARRTNAKRRGEHRRGLTVSPDWT